MDRSAQTIQVNLRIVASLGIALTNPVRLWYYNHLINRAGATQAILRAAGNSFRTSTSVSADSAQFRVHWNQHLRKNSGVGRPPANTARRKKQQSGLKRA